MKGPSPSGFCINTFLAYSVGHDNNFVSMLEVSDLEDMIEVTMQDLNKEQKLRLESSNETRNKMVQKASLPNPSITMSPMYPSAEAAGT